ncbi:MAG TPA: hypothetical protein VIJ63_10825 [Roseiarcus sp.]
MARIACESAVISRAGSRELRLEKRTPALDEGRKSRRAGGRDWIEIKMRAGREDALVPTRAERNADSRQG